MDAFKKLHTDKKLVIAGGSSDTHWYIGQLKEQAGGDDRIIFTGFVDGALREELYSNAYLFVLPSDLEGMPLCLLEAMSYGNCVITSDIEECYNVIHDNGIVFRKGDVDDLAQKLTYAPVSLPGRLFPHASVFFPQISFAVFLFTLFMVTPC